MSGPYRMTSLNLTSLEVFAPNTATWDWGFNIGIWGRDTNRCQAQTGHKHLASLGLSGKESACNARDMGLIPGSGRSPGEGNANSLQCSCLGNPMGGGAWWIVVHGVTKESNVSLVTKQHRTFGPSHTRNQKWGPVSHCSKDNKEARLVERKVCFILDASNRGRGRVDTCPKADSPTLLTISGQECSRTEGGTPHRNNTVSSDCHLVIGPQRSEQHHPDCLKYVNLQFQGRLVPTSLRPVLGIVAAYVIATLWSLCINS